MRHNIFHKPWRNLIRHLKLFAASEANIGERCSKTAFFFDSMSLQS
ncbi:hypothetical protein YPPY66_2088 [Yersinia pestis PY-66]|uniref:Uncharacterized protein n=3 Tax=Yersinia pseudotuberculosis complex TaxID=1649845 RepID=A0A0U1QVC7_YERP3|nr:hypothetical protein YpsIP31758_1572 [Yersinia pseudotuberculosis IP 31758]EDR32185.1 hypothetical protein YPIP275_0605 [Yersinia pestis biovar Orientalis str. IP275]EIQ92567.1 hypothetical protein YPPY03_1938 [Yersinia pestis PY-03]EIR03895.1 hypothetical protein YPPY04_1880 [Yersinia pestis PY-04]EIR07806.1 hypothetical protein YPPY06_1925 [Yersinia pestis PY-06]EIR19152.1 hypothetical protein YPPY07_1794 [Yersinia pestis PY-07]EIR20046.1 hypothetical protein YPPY08_1904 [Yersinia pestis